MNKLRTVQEVAVMVDREHGATGGLEPILREWAEAILAVIGPCAAERKLRRDLGLNR